MSKVVTTSIAEQVRQAMGAVAAGGPRFPRQPFKLSFLPKHQMVGEVQLAIFSEESSYAATNIDCKMFVNSFGFPLNSHTILE